MNLSVYQKSIVQVTGCEFALAPVLEDIMRNDIFHSTLDWLDESTFNKGAREAEQLYVEVKRLAAQGDAEMRELLAFYNENMVTK